MAPAARRKPFRKAAARKAPMRRHPARKAPFRHKFALRRKSRSFASFLRPNSFVKLHWEYELNYTGIAAGASQAITFYPMNPCPSQLAAPGTGDQLYTGLQQYMDYWSQGKIFASRISVKVSNVTLSPNTTSLKTALYALPYTVDLVNNPSNDPSVVAGKTLAQIMANTATKTRELMSGQNSRNTTTMTMFRRSKAMLGKSKLKDDTLATFSGDNSMSHSDWTYPSDVWYYQVNTFNLSPIQGVSVNYTVKIDSWCQLFNNNWLDPAILT